MSKNGHSTLSMKTGENVCRVPQAQLMSNKRDWAIYLTGSVCDQTPISLLLNSPPPVSATIRLLATLLPERLSAAKRIGLILITGHSMPNGVGSLVPTAFRLSALSWTCSEKKLFRNRFWQLLDWSIEIDKLFLWLQFIFQVSSSTRLQRRSGKLSFLPKLSALIPSSNLLVVRRVQLRSACVCQTK